MRIRRSPADAESGGPAAPPVPLKPGAPFAGLRVRQHLGTGSLCAAYLCETAAGEKRVLKLLQPRKSSDPVFNDEFLFLARSVARYRHPGIARIYAAGTVDGEAYYVTEYLAGPPLRAWLLDRLTFARRVPPGLALLRDLIGVFRAVQERGCYGVLKPENVFLVPARGPVVTDFGVPGFLSPPEFEFNAYARRYLPYMAPELRRDWSNLLPQSDVYSLGAILYEILVGRPPSQPLKATPSEASELFGVEADELVLKAMAANPFDRFSSLEDFDAAVAALEGEMRGLADREDPVPASETGLRDTATLNATDLLPAARLGDAEGGEEAGALRGQGTEVLPREAAGTETERLQAFSPAPGSGEYPALDEEPSPLEEESRPIPRAAELMDGDDEPIPYYVWLLLFVLALALCVLAALLGSGTPVF